MHDYVDIVKKIVLKKIDLLEFDIFLFGSRADGTAREMSDIDVGVLGKQKLNMFTKSDLEQMLEDCIVPFKVDLIDFYSVSDAFKQRAMQHVVYWNKAKNMHSVNPT